MEECLAVGRTAAVLGDQSQEGAAGVLGSAGDLGDEGAADPAIVVGEGDSHRQNPRLFTGMGWPAVVAAEVAGELELGDPDNCSAEFGHDYV